MSKLFAGAYNAMPFQVPEADLGSAIPEGITARDWAIAGITLVAFIVVSQIAGRVVRRLIARTDTDPDGVIAGFVGKVVQNLIVFIGIFYALSVLGVQLGPLLGALGISGIAIAIALTPILENVFASVVLKTRRPLARGDEIDTNDHSGLVEEINFRTVVLRDFSGQKVIIPSSQVNDSPLVNRTTNGDRRSSISVGVAYATDLRRAQSILLNAARGVDGVDATPAAEVIVTGFGDSSIDFEMRVWHAPDNRTTNRIKSEVAIAAHVALGAAGIEIPFPQRVVTMVAEDVDNPVD